MPPSSCDAMPLCWSGKRKPASGEDIELWVAGNATSSTRRSQSDSEPLHPSATGSDTGPSLPAMAASGNASASTPSSATATTRRLRPRRGACPRSGGGPAMAITSSAATATSSSPTAKATRRSAASGLSTRNIPAAARPAARSALSHVRDGVAASASASARARSSGLSARRRASATETTTSPDGRQRHVEHQQAPEELVPDLAHRPLGLIGRRARAHDPLPHLQPDGHQHPDDGQGVAERAGGVPPAALRNDQCRKGGERYGQGDPADHLDVLRDLYEVGDRLAEVALGDGRELGLHALGDLGRRLGVARLQRLNDENARAAHGERDAVALRPAEGRVVQLVRRRAHDRPEAARPHHRLRRPADDRLQRDQVRLRLDDLPRQGGAGLAPDVGLLQRRLHVVGEAVRVEDVSLGVERGLRHREREGEQDQQRGPP